MSTMILRPGRALSAILALGAMTAVAPVPARSQEPRPRVRVERDDCRCVDRDGQEIENCTCFRTPDVGGILARVLPLRESRARLGITITEETDAADASRGARIQSVMESGPAAEAGLRKDDIITALDGKSLLRPLGGDEERDFDLEGSVAVQRLMALIRDIEPGQEVRVDYLRDGEPLSTSVKARELSAWGVGVAFPRWGDEPGAMAEAMDDVRGRLREFRFEPGAPGVLQVRPPDAPGAPARIRSSGFFFGGAGECPGDRADAWTISAGSNRCVAGVALEELNPKLGEYFGTSQGVLVTDVGEDSTLGLEPGDVILEVGGREATDPERVRRIVGSYDEGEAITFRIMRQKREMSVQGRLGG